jgi:hypothetical protein
VGSFELDRSPFGCFDMGGNTSEWVADCLAPFPEGPLVDYMRRNTKVRYHVVRGGCWTYASEGGFETTRRGGYWREKDRSNIGFRVALSHSPPSEGPQEEPHALWNPEVGTQYDLALHCQEGNDTTLASIELWLRATAESLDGPRATLRFTLNRIRRSYGPRLGGSRVFDSEVADSEPELQHLVGKTFTGSLNMDTGRLRDLDGLGPIRDAYVAGRDAPSDTRKTPFGKWTPLNHMKAFLGDGFLESALARLLWQGEATPLPWQRTSSEGEAPQTIRLRSGSRDALFSYMLLKGVKPTDQVAWEGQAEFEPGRFEGSTSRGDLVSGERHSGWSKTKLTMVRVGD